MKRILSIAALALVSVLSSNARADLPPVSDAQSAYCHVYAEAEYQAAIVRGDEFPDASYEGRAEECEFQWIMINAANAH